MRLCLKQLELDFPEIVVVASRAVVGQAHRLPNVVQDGGTRCPQRVDRTSTAEIAPSSEKPVHLRKRDHALERQARELLRANGAEQIANDVRVEWNPRLKSCAGRAEYRDKLISLNPQLLNLDPSPAQRRLGLSQLDGFNPSSLTTRRSNGEEKGVPDEIIIDEAIRDEVDRTLRHELAHLLAQFRAGRKRIAPHGKEWRAACVDLGIGDEKRCHNLPFSFVERARRFLYRCPNCQRDFPRVRKIRRAIACLACCRAHNHGNFDARFRLRLVCKPAGQ